MNVVCCILYSAIPGVKIVQVVLSGLRLLFVSMYVCMTECLFFTMFMSFICVDVMVMSSAYVVRFIGACGVGVSDVYMLNNVGDRTPPCVTPVLFLNVVYVLRPMM